MTYLGPDGRQYVAVYAGVGGAAMLAKNMPGFPARGSTLYVFSLDGESVATGIEMPETAAGGATKQTDASQTGRR
jgi:alcohol dehydrogenase (cytochrome c)